MSVLTEFMGGIADAIRADGKTAGPIPAAEFAEQIQEKVLASFGADATPETILEGSTAYVKGELIEGTLKQAKSRVEFFDLNSDGFPRKIVYIYDGICPKQFFAVNTNSVGNNAEAYMREGICVDVEIYAKELLEESFANVFYSFVGKLKLVNVTKLCDKVFREIGRGNSSTSSILKRAVWLPKTITAISAESKSESPFIGANNTTKIYCEVSSKPDGWSSYWNYHGGFSGPSGDQLTTTWGVTEAEFDKL